MMATQATGDVDIPVSRDDKDVDLTPPGEETWEQLSDTRLFILGAAFFALWAGNVGAIVGSVSCSKFLRLLGLICFTDFYDPTCYPEGIRNIKKSGTVGSCFEHDSLGKRKRHRMDIDLTDRGHLKSSLEGVAISTAESGRYIVEWSSSYYRTSCRLLCR
jgi:hypothetical protein